MQYKRRERAAAKSLAAVGIATGLVLGLAPISDAASSTITATAAYEIAHAGILSTTAFCGTKKITLGVVDCNKAFADVASTASKVAMQVTPRAFNFVASCFLAAARRLLTVPSGMRS